MKLSRQIFHGVLLTNAVTVVEMLVGFTQHLILVRFLLGLREFGTLGFFQAGFGILAIFFNLSLNNSAIRFGGAAIARNDEREFYAIQGTAAVLTLLLNLLLLGVTLVLSAMGFEYKGRVVGDYYFLLALNSIAGIAGGFAATIYTTRKEFRKLTVQQMMSTIVSAICVLAVAYHLRTARGALHGMIAGSCVVSLISLWMVRHDLLLARIDFKLTRSFSAYGSGFALTSIVKQFFWNADVVLLGLFTNEKAVGLYRIAQTVANPLMRVFSPLWTVLFPTVSIESARGNIDRVKKLLTRGTQWLLLGNLPIVIAGTYLLDFVIPKLYGGAQAAIFPIRLLLWGYVIGTITSVSPPILRVYRNDLAFLTTFVAAILNILLNLILIPRLGINGAALASFISFGLLALAVYIYAFRAIGIPVPPLLNFGVAVQIVLTGLMMATSILNYFWAALGLYALLLLFLFGYKMVTVAELKTYVTS
jgi:O-antigen/teichoic acid export membrane protein